VEKGSDKMTTYTAKEVAAMLKVNYRTILNLISQGKLKAIKIGSKIFRVEEDELKKYMNREG